MRQLFKGDCLDKMRDIPDGSVDLILTDPPYGTTQCKWDSVIPFAPMWEQLKRVIKKNGAIVLTASQPFTSAIVMSNTEMFKYCWVWEKTKKTNHLNAKHQPLRQSEDVVVFCKGKSRYFPQGTTNCEKSNVNKATHISDNYGSVKVGVHVQTQTGYPSNIIKIASQGNTVHPTQKPVALLEYLIKTYTHEGETVLDFTMGSGSTGVACVNTGRKFIGIELDENYFEIATNRIDKAVSNATGG